jgi:hypothetical protein
MSRSRRITHVPQSIAPPSRSAAGGHVRRVNITLPELQHDELQARGANVSGLIRTLLDDHLSGTLVTLRVSEQTKRLYDQVLESVNPSDEEVAQALVHALESILDRRMADLKRLREELKNAGK